MKEPEQTKQDRIARDIFLHVVELQSAEERAAYLDGACRLDEDLRLRVEALLRSDASDSFLELPAMKIPMADATDSLPCEVSGSVIGSQNENSADPIDRLRVGPFDKLMAGRYKLLEKIGEGGMGVVYMAEQTEPVLRKVALKIIKLGMDTKQVVARFEAERQALALMDHPNIAKVLDGGTTETGRPYFVMELVQGIPITEFCDKNKLTTKERIELFLPVCQAIQSAHQKGIIHRDIKPNNVLVSFLHGEPVAKVIDFGIAKATNQKLTEKTLFTQFASMIGTPAYMSPEQAEMSVIDVDTRTDVYSLGVLLYELLTGTTPFPEKRLRSAGYGEMRRIIAEEEPEKPSTRMSTIEGELKTAVSRFRKADIPALQRDFKGDLDWIAMKCLEKDRRRRYETPSELAADLRRHLNDEPVSAAAPSSAYRFQKAWRRNKVVYTAGTAVFAALVIGISISVWQAISARHARDGEKLQRTLAEQSQKEAEANAQAAQRQQQAAERNERRAISLAEEMRLRSYVSDMKAAQVALDRSNFLRARMLLDRYLPQTGETDLRGLEWRYLWSLARGNERDKFDPHNGIASYAGYSPDGRFLATAGFDHKMKIWDAATHRPVTELEIGDLPADFNRMNFVPFSPDGKRFAAIQGGELKLWDTTTWSVVDHFGEAEYPVIFASRTNLLTARVGRITKIWNLETGQSQEVPPEKFPKGYAQPWALSPNGKLFAQSRNGSRLTLWKLPEVEKIVELEQSASNALLFSPSGKLLAQAGGCELRLWDVDARKIIAKTQAHPDRFVGLAFSPDGSLLATSGADQLVHLWSVPELTSVETYQGHINEIWKVNFSPDGRTLVSGGKERTIRFWDVSSRSAKGEETGGPEGALGLLDRVYIDSHTQSLTSLEKDDFFQYWKIDQGRLAPDIRLHVALRQSAVFSGDGKLYVNPTKGGYELFDSWTSQAIKKITINEGRVYRGPNTLSTDGKLLVGWAGPEDGWRILDIESEKEIARLPGPSTVAYGFRSAFSPDGRILAYPGPDWTFRLWDVAERKELAVLAGHTWTVRNCDFSHDGKLLVTTSWDGAARIWEAPSGKLHVPPLLGHVVSINSTAFTPDGRTLLTCGDDFTLRMWNVSTGQEMLLIPQISGMMLADGGDTMVFGIEGKPGSTLVSVPTLEEIDKIEAQGR